MERLLIEENYNQINRMKDIKKEIIFNFCDVNYGGIPFRVINKIYELGIPVFSLKTMGIEEFGSLYGIKKKDTLDKIQSNFDKAINQSYSILSLLPFGLSNTIVNQLIELGFKKLHEIFFLTEEELSTKYNFSQSTSEKIITAVEKTKFDIDDFIRFEDFNTYSVDRIKNIDYINSFKKYIIDIVSKYDYPVSISYLKKQLSNRYELLNFKLFLNDLEKENKITIKDDCVTNYLPSFDEFLKSIPNIKEKYVLFKRYYNENITLRDLAEEKGVSRERIRQMISKVSIPKLKEDQYGYYQENYNISDKIYNKVFGLSNSSIKYLRLTYKKGKKKIIDLVDDENLPDDLKQKLLDNIEGKLVINGEKILANKFQLLIYVLKNICNCNTYLTKDILRINNEFAGKIGHPELMLDEKYFHSHIAGHRYICLSSRGVEDEAFSGYRYLDKCSPDIKSMITKLNLDDYKDVEISASVIYKSNITLMIENDIRDEYELHNVLRYNINNDYITFGRSPMIIFGNGNRDRQIMDLIAANSPIEVSKLVDILNDTFGYNKNSILSYVESKFSDYYNNGILDLESSKVDENIIEELKKYLTEDVYFFEDIVEICEKNNIDYSSNILSKNSLKQLGYISNSSYMFKNKYSCFKEYMDKNYFIGDFENLNNVDSRIFKLVLFNSFYLDKVKKLEYVEYKYKEFISLKKLESFGITKTDICDFIKSVESFVDDELIFTTDYLKNIGFKHRLFTFGFESIFYDSILLNSECFKSNRSGLRETVFVSKKSNNDPTVANIINQIMGDSDSIKMTDLVEKYKVYGKSSDLETKYYNIIHNTNLKYDAETKSIVKC